MTDNGATVKVEELKDHTIVLETQKNAANPVKYSSLPAANNDINSVAPVVMGAIENPIADKDKNAKPLLPLQQPMVAFPHHAVDNQQKNASNVNTAKNTPATTMPVVVNASIPTSAAGVTNQQLLAVSPNYYTIQLTSDRKLDNLERFIKANKLQDKATYFRTYDMQDRELYILIYGQYSNSADAKAALEKLPQRAKDEGAFVVKFSTIQTVLKKPTPAKQ